MADEVTPLEVLRARISKIVTLSLDDVEKTLATGTPAAKASIIKTAIPALVKILGEEEKGDELAEMRKMISELTERDRMGIAGMQDAGGPSTEGSQGRGEGAGMNGEGGKVIPFSAVDLPTDSVGG